MDESAQSDPESDQSSAEPSESSPGTRRITRRQVLTLLGTGALALAGVVGYTMLVEPYWITVKRRTMALDGLPPELEGKTLLQLSDLHIGDLVDEDFIIRALREIRELQPDILVLTGDITHDGLPRGHQGLIRILREFPSTPLGAFAILGNHDYGHTPGRLWQDEDLADQVALQCENHGIRILRNQSANVRGLQILGLDDFWTPRFDPEPVLSSYNPSKPAIALCHNPDVCDLPVWGNFQGWILAGHTHGGQCKPPFLPPPMLPVKNRTYTSGHFQVGPNRDLYINPGLGYIIPARFNVRPELTLFTLTNRTSPKPETA